MFGCIKGQRQVAPAHHRAMLSEAGPTGTAASIPVGPLLRGLPRDVIPALRAARGRCFRVHSA